jgi:hypothetical protein
MLAVEVALVGVSQDLLLVQDNTGVVMVSLEPVLVV